MKRSYLKRLTSMLLMCAMCLTLASQALAADATVEATAAVMRLSKTEGTVSVTNSSGRSVSVREKLRLYNGYGVVTQKSSYAWINLDDEKLIKEDALSEIEIRKNGKKLDLLLKSGNVYFEVSEPLKDDETFHIRTSTMALGIRGTCGWVKIIDQWTSRLYVLEGAVEVSAVDPVTGESTTETVTGGESATCIVYPQDYSGDKCEIILDRYAEKDIAGFALVEIADDNGLRDKIHGESGLDLSASAQEAEARLRQEQDSVNKMLDDIDRQTAEQENNVSTDPVWSEPTPDDSAPPAATPDDGGGPTTTAPAVPAIYTVTFDANGGTLSGPSSATTNTDGKISFPTEPTNDTPRPESKTGAKYVFDGWYTAAEGGGQADSATAFTQNTTLYAHWKLDGWDWELNGNTLRIYGTGAMDNFSYNAQPWSVSKDDIESVVIEDGITSIGSNAFYDCTVLTSVTVPEGVTSIGISAFRNCSSLTSVTIPESVTSIGGSAFDGCSSLTSVTIPESVTSIGGSAFFLCGKLTGVTISEGVASIGDSAFQYCTKLTSITIPESVTNIGSRSFNSCSSLTEIAVDTQNQNYSSIDGVLFSKDQAELIQYPEGKTNTNYAVPSTVTSIDGYAFSDCKLTSITIPEGVTSIGDYAFYSCDLTSITIPNSVTSIGNSVFRLCTGLTSVTIPESVANIDSRSFDSCTNLTTINYTGTQAQWSGININSSSGLSGKTVICTDGPITIS